MNLKAIFNVQGHLLTLLALILLVPAGLAAFFQDPTLPGHVSPLMGFILTAVLAGISGFLLKKYLPLGFEAFRDREGFVIVALSVTGPGLGEVGPSGNYAHLPFVGKWVLIACMLLGRLEMFSVMLLFMPRTWRK